MQALLFIYSSNARTLDNMSSFVAKDHRIGHLTLTQNFNLVLNEACMPLTNFKGSMMYHNTQAECWGNSKRLEGKESWSNEIFFRGNSTWALVLEGRLGFQQAKNGLGDKVAKAFSPGQQYLGWASGAGMLRVTNGSWKTGRAYPVQTFGARQFCYWRAAPCTVGCLAATSCQ